jgi:hypothetical protein
MTTCRLFRGLPRIGQSRGSREVDVHATIGDGMALGMAFWGVNHAKQDSGARVWGGDGGAVDGARSSSASHATPRAPVTGDAAGGFRIVGAGPPPPAGAGADLSRGRAWGLPQLLSGTERGSRLQCNLRPGIPAERHGDRSARKLLLAPRLRPYRPGDHCELRDRAGCARALRRQSMACRE